MTRYLDPKNDMVFKKIFGQNPHLLISFLNSLLPSEGDKGFGYINEVVEIEKVKNLNAKSIKKSVLKVVARESNKRYCVFFVFWIEDLFEYHKMQHFIHNNYWAYSNNSPICTITLFEKPFEDEECNYYDFYSFYEGWYLISVELARFKPQNNIEKKQRNLWLRFLKEIDEETRVVPPELQENMFIKEALYLCAEAAFTDAERYEYDKYWDIIRTENTLMEGKIKEGMEKGKAEERQTIARNLLKLGIPFENIAQATGLTIPEIQVLK